MSDFVFMAWKTVPFRLASIESVASLVGRSEGLVLATFPNPSVVGVILEIASLTSCVGGYSGQIRTLTRHILRHRK